MSWNILVFFLWEQTVGVSSPGAHSLLLRRWASGTRSEFESEPERQHLMDVEIDQS